jgi:hypothetical protein
MKKNHTTFYITPIGQVYQTKIFVRKQLLPRHIVKQSTAQGRGIWSYAYATIYQKGKIEMDG